MERFKITYLADVMVKQIAMDNYKFITKKIGDVNRFPLVDFNKQWIDNMMFFPKSYETYSKELGYGLLCNLFIIYLPWAGEYNLHPDSWFVQNIEMKDLFQYYLDVELSIFDENDKKLLEFAEPFAKSENGEFLFWDKRVVLENNEMPIYFTDFASGIFYVGSTIYELITIVTGEEYKNVLKFYTKQLPLTFESFN